MWVILNLSLIIFFSVILGLIIFAIERTKGTTWFINLKVSKGTKVLVEGMVYGAFIITLNILMEDIAETQIAYWLIAFFILVSTREITIATVGLAPATIFYLFTQNINIITYSLNSLIFSLLIFFVILKFFLGNLLSRTIAYPNLIIISIVIWLVLSYTNNSISLNNSINQIVFTSVGCVLGEMLVFWLIKISVSANVLYESINFSFSKYYRPQLKDKIIGEKIKEKNIKRALFIVFNIEVDSEDEHTEIIEVILKNLEKTLPKNSILFLGNNGKYGAFIPIYDEIKSIKGNHEYNFKNSLDVLRLIVERQNSSFKLQNEKKVGVRVFAGVSFYGLQSDSLIELENNAIFALSYIEKNSLDPVMVFNPMELIKRKSEVSYLSNLEEVIELSSLKLVYKPIYGAENINIVEFKSSIEEEYNSSLSEYINFNGLTDVYNRYLAAMAIKTAENFKGSLAVPYSFDTFKKLEIQNFSKRIKLMNWSINKLIFMVYSNEIKKEDKILKLFNELRSLGARFAFVSLKPKQKHLIEYYKPEFLFFKSVEKALIKENSFIINIKDEKELESALDKKIKKLSGILLSAKSKPHIFPKQSKIYIENIKKKRGTNA